eukprot:COSAG02_NODE_4165_length_5680_cov_13.045164_1_plen_64_part_00
MCKHSVLWLARLFGVVVNRSGYRLTSNKIEGLCVYVHRFKIMHHLFYFENRALSFLPPQEILQ